MYYSNNTQNKVPSILLAKHGWYYHDKKVVCDGCGTTQDPHQTIESIEDYGKKYFFHQPGCRFHYVVMKNPYEPGISSMAILVGSGSSSSSDTNNTGGGGGEDIHVPAPISIPAKRKSPTTTNNNTVITNSGSSASVSSFITDPYLDTSDPEKAIYIPGNIRQICRHENMIKYRERLTTFTDREFLFPVKAKSLARAGFFYRGYGNAVKCFCCGIALGNWKIHDDPWLEHRMYSKRDNCVYLAINCPESLNNAGVYPKQQQQKRYKKSSDEELRLDRGARKQVIQLGNDNVLVIKNDKVIASNSSSNSSNNPRRGGGDGNDGQWLTTRRRTAAAAEEKKQPIVIDEDDYILPGHRITIHRNRQGLRFSCNDNNKKKTTNTTTNNNINSVTIPFVDELPDIDPLTPPPSPSLLDGAAAAAAATTNEASAEAERTECCLINGKTIITSDDSISEELISTIVGMGYTTEQLFEAVTQVNPVNCASENIRPINVENVLEQIVEIDRQYALALARQEEEEEVAAPPALDDDGQDLVKPPRPSTSSTSNRPVAASAASSSSAAAEKTETAAAPDEKSLCICCLTEQKSILFRPCNHMISCDVCAWKIEVCPMCREPALEKVHVYWS